MAFPTTLDDLDASRGTATQRLNNPSHVTHHLNEDTLIEALQAKVGIDGSAVTTSLDYILKNTTGGHDHDGTDSKKVLTTNLDVTGLTALQLLRVNTGGTAIESSGVAVSDLVTATSTTTLTNKTLTTPTITKPTMDATNPSAQTYSPAGAGTATLDLSLANEHRITMPAGNITIALSNDTLGQKFIVSILQDATGSRTVTWFATIRWAGGSAPTLTTTASKRDTFGFIRTGTTTYDGFIIGQNL